MKKRPRSVCSTHEIRSLSSSISRTVSAPLSARAASFAEHSSSRRWPSSPPCFCTFDCSEQSSSLSHRLPSASRQTLGRTCKGDLQREPTVLRVQKSFSRMSWKCVHPSPYMTTVVFLLLMNQVGILAFDDYRCGAAGAGKSCPNGLCCSSFGWCGNTSAYCSDGHSDKNGKSGGTESSTSISASGSLSVSSEGTDSSDTSSDTSPSNGSNDTTTKIPSDGNDHHKHGHSDKHKKHEDTESSTSVSANASLSLSSESDSSDTFPSGNDSNGTTTKIPSDSKDHHKHEHSDKHKKCDAADSQTSVTASGSVSVSSESTNTSNASPTNGSNGTTAATPTTGASSTPPPTTTTQSPTTGISSILSSAMFDQFLPNRTNPAYPAKGFYTYDAFIKAANDKMFQGFGTTKDADTQKREIAAFFANVAHETQGGGYIEENNKSTYCNATCPAGKQYFGRGPLQLSWNYGYDAAGKALGLDLLNDPGKLASDNVLAFKSSLWFWMSSQSPSCHEAMVNDKGFGSTIKIINGGLECGDTKSPDGAVEQQNRISLYGKYCKILGVSPGNALTC